MVILKILFVTHYSRMYGANKSLLNLIDGLVSIKDVTPFVILPGEGELIHELEKRDIIYEMLAFSNWASKVRTIRETLLSIKNNCYLVWKSRQLVKEWKIDLIYTNSVMSPFGWLLSKVTGIPHIWHIREFGDIDYRQVFHFGKTLSSWIIKQSGHVICNSGAVRNHFFSQKNKNITVIYNGILPKSEIQRNHYDKNEGLSAEFTFAIVGILDPTKGQHIAIQAISELNKKNRPCKLLIIGDGDTKYKKTLVDLVSQEQLMDQIMFYGYVDNVFELLHLSDALLVCSENEAMGRIIIEGMIAGVPVIAHNAGGIPELINHGVTGYLYDSEYDLEKLMEIVMVSPDHNQQIKKNAYEGVAQKYSVETYSASVLEIIKKVTGI